MAEIFQVTIQVSRGGHNLMSLQEFLGMAIAERTDHILAGRVQFLTATGETVPLLDAVKASELQGGS